ncbi:pentachlorophenol 4-monooxygenase [Moniliophthora roreri MCA 2997]|uniref:Pentachlorophenol 4-monooxygenase n=1 Tax=Moniliophthora roreri (strain MCA 2997) TaxID=1381753 RepID=V2X6U2_MONRO|nr:pentachlorophenol 4-monooxygenase [Moniliophthora roreri MCA 2997]
MGFTPKITHCSGGYPASAPITIKVLGFSAYILTVLYLRIWYPLFIADLIENSPRGMSEIPNSADVVIIGAGPVGALIAYQLARYGCRPLLIEQEDKTLSNPYGRACTLWPRTIELLDQLDLAERLLQTGVVTRTGLHFYEGRRVKGGLMYGSRMDKLGDTFFKFALHLRQKLTEDEFTAAFQEYGFNLHMRHAIESYALDEVAIDEYPIRVQIKDLTHDHVVQVKTRYLIGADGGKSTVRKLAKIPFDGEYTKNRWIRMDAKVKTNMPNPRCLNSIDSRSHGQILWCPTDNGLTRIGYVFSQTLLEKYGGVEGVTREVAMEEAKKAIEPFELEFEDMQWFTIYGIGQRIARSFSDVGNGVFLAGDACHTHSSGSAQGLNTGIHDAVNLAWKLALRIHGIAKGSLLASYDEERRSVVQQVIDNDKTISTLISGEYPPRFQGRTESIRDILTEWFDDMNMQAFTLGLGISYPSNAINREVNGPSRATLNPGERGPDVYLTSIGTGDPIRLQKVLKNDAKFSVVIFAGNPSHTCSAYSVFTGALPPFIQSFPARAFKWFTITSVSGNGGQEVLGMTPIGKVYFDENVKAHEIYGVDIQKGAVVVFRPDGWVGTVVELNERGVNDLMIYFDLILERSG